MNRLEELANEAYDEQIVLLDNFSFQSERIKGLYCDHTIALSKKIKTQNEKACVLSEELGHHHTTYGTIIKQSVTENRKQEHRARTWSYNHHLGLQGIISAYKYGCRSVNEAADYLEVTEQFLIDAIQYYKNKYGTHTSIDHYLIFFEPLSVLELY